MGEPKKPPIYLLHMSDDKVLIAGTTDGTQALYVLGESSQVQYLLYHSQVKGKQKQITYKD
jgi:hypothetical protein